MEAILLAVLAFLGIGVVASRPVKRFKKKMRGVGVKRNGKPHKRRRKAERGVYHKNYLRLYPNLGFQFGDFHWCRAKKHRGH